MKKCRINGLVLAVVAAVVAGCSHPKDPFRNKMTRPTEVCLPTGQFEERLIQTQEAFHEQAPMQYVVRKGDTLWSIAKRFLAKPWYWKEVWYDNPQVRNPHLIYPGDVLSIVTVNGQQKITITEANPVYRGKKIGRVGKKGLPVYKYSPHLREISKLEEKISLGRNAIHAHQLRGRILSPEQIAGLPMIFGEGEGYLTLSMQNKVYAQGIYHKPLPPAYNRLAEIKGRFDNTYDVLRPALAITQSEPVASGEKPKIVAQEMQYVATIEAVASDYQRNITTFEPLEVAQQMLEGDVIVPTDLTLGTTPRWIAELLDEKEIDEEAASRLMGLFPDYFPKLPSMQCSRGYIVGSMNKTTLGVREYDSLIVSFGKKDGAQVGDIWKIVRLNPARSVGGVMVEVPPKELGYLMITGVHDEASIGFVLETSENVYFTDHLVRP